MAYTGNWEEKVYGRKYGIYVLMLLFFLGGVIFTDMSFRQIYEGKRENRILSFYPHKDQYNIWFLGHQQKISRFIYLTQFQQKKDRFYIRFLGREVSFMVPTWQKLKSLVIK